MLLSRSEKSLRILLTIALADKMIMVSPKFMSCCFIYLLIFPTIFDKSNSKLDDPDSSLAAKRTELSENVRNMFYYAYYNYTTYALPHDELKPLTKTFTDSFSGFENSKNGQPGQYNGSAITLIESLSSLVIMGYHPDFKTAVEWISQNLSFDVDARINLYEWNTRVLGGLVSAHILATDLLQGTYDNWLLDLAEDLGRRFLPAFDTPTGLPYAWINLKYGVMMEETTVTTTAECGSLILEMGALSRLTCDTEFESAALRALRKLWSMRSSLDLLGTKLNVVTGEWIQYSSGIGAGMDSFYETLVKAHILFGRDEFWTMFQSAYIAVQRYMRHGPWYKNADMRTGEEIPINPASLHAFWPGLQVLIGDIESAKLMHLEFYSFWLMYGVLPDRFIDDDFSESNYTFFEYLSFVGAYSVFPFWPLMKLSSLSPTERRYPLRPELIESTFYLYQATKDPLYLQAGEYIMSNLVGYTQVSAGFASIKDVITMNLEDHQPGYFLSETLMYLYLLFNDSFLDNDNYIFTTKGHPLPVMSPGDHERNIPRHSGRGSTVGNPLASLIQKLEKGKKPSALSAQVCPCTAATAGDYITAGIESACHVLDAFPDHSCSTHEECGVDLSSCIPRACSSKGYCGDGYFTSYFETIRLSDFVMDVLHEKFTGGKNKNKTKTKSRDYSLDFGSEFFM